MASPKGKRKERTRKDAVAKEYDLITREEMHAREAKYMTRLTDLGTCRNGIEDAFVQIENQIDAQTKIDKWNDYLRCEGLPKPYKPEDIRLFFEKMRFFESEDVEKTIDWLLSVDERSILSQDIYRTDRTRRTLVKELRTKFGDIYAANIDLALKVCKSIEYYLEDPRLYMKSSERVLSDVVEQKSVVQREIRNLLDRYSYRILSSERAYMKSVNAVTSEYYHDAPNFGIHIWTLINVPILFPVMDVPHICANLHQLNIKVYLPYNNLQENLTLRAVHLNFDHCSEHAKSFRQTAIVLPDNFNVTIEDLHDRLINEWSMQLQICAEIRNDMIAKRLDYDEKMLLEGEADKVGKKKVPGKEKEPEKQPTKALKEPPNITDDLFPDIRNDFLKWEQKQYENYINAVYHPDKLELTEHEINLKKFFVLGGVYQLDFVTKPEHYDFNNFNMTWHLNNAQLKINKDVLSKPNDGMTMMKSIASQSTAELSRSTLGRKTEKDAEDEDDVEPSEFFVLRFQLPEYLCRWGQPIACHFQADVIGHVEKVVEVQEPVKATTPSTRRGSRENSLIRIASAYTTATNITNVTNFTAATSISSYFNLPISASSFSRSRSNFPPSFSMLTLLRTSSVNAPINIENFNLNFPLMKNEIRHLKRHCLPRIISSFKFPNEVKDEETEETRNKSKGKGGTLVRKRTSLDEPNQPAINDRLFTYEQQNNPERLFPLFEKSEHLKLPFRFEEFSGTIRLTEPQTFFELIDVLDQIKHIYRRKYERTMNLPLFKSNFPFANKTKMLPKKTIAPAIEEKKLKHLRSRRSTMPLGKHKSYILGSLKEQKDDDTPTHSLQDHEQPEQDTRETFKFSHWATEHIMNSTYDKKNCKITIWTDRLGTFGFAFKRYEHFPFRFWSVEPSEAKPETEVVLTIETQYVKCVLFVTAEGFRGYVTEPTKKSLINRVMYLVIENPLSDFKELKRLFVEKNLNIFSEFDAQFYIENGYFSEKHYAAELHTYACMAINSGWMKFLWSSWNRLARRRDIILQICIAESKSLVRITPEDATFVEIEEVCSDDLDVITLSYTPTWKNLEFYADLNQLITGLFADAKEMRAKDVKLIVNLRKLLCEIRPLSFS